jgi:hypothetical protein
MHCTSSVALSRNCRLSRVTQKEVLYNCCCMEQSQIALLWFESCVGHGARMRISSPTIVLWDLSGVYLHLQLSCEISLVKRTRLESCSLSECLSDIFLEFHQSLLRVHFRIVSWIRPLSLPFELKVILGEGVSCNVRVVKVTLLPGIVCS